jgi:hypothetical protein
MSLGNYFDIKKKIYSNIMPRKKVEISSTTDLKKVKSTLYNMIRTSNKNRW